MKSKNIKYTVAIFVAFLFSSVYSHAQLIGPVVSLTGSVYDAITKEPVTVVLTVSDETGKKINGTRSNATNNGYYYLTSMKAGHKYTISISQANYMKEKYEMFIADANNYTELSHDFLVKPMTKGIKLPLKVPPFEFSKSKLRVGADQIISEIKGTLVNNPNVKFEIICYPDNNDDKKENKTMTDERAKSLMNFFVSNGIDAGRISTSGSATTDPDNPPPTKKSAKGKRYIGTSYIKITEF